MDKVMTQCEETERLHKEMTPSELMTQADGTY